MARVLTEIEIAELRATKKPVTAAQRNLLRNPRATGRHRDFAATIRTRSPDGKRFEIRVRKSPDDPKDFSVIASYRATGGTLYTLFRCNGHHGPHPNRLEIKAKSGVQVVPANRFHVHYLTERYQQFGKPDGYAEETTEFANFEAAVDYACDFFGFFDPNDSFPSKYPLFENPSP